MSANAYKRLSISDNFVIPYTANRSWDILSSSFAANNITVNVGINTTNSLFDPINEYKTNGQYDRLVYNSVNLTYYPDFLPYVLSTSSLQNTIYNDGNLSTSSYFNGYTNLGNPNTIKFYPTGNGATIYAINVPRSLSSDKILPTTFEVDFASGSSTYKIYDDGNYNLLYSGSNISSSIGTLLTQGSYVGNVFYEQNIAILTIIPDSVRLRGWRGINPYCIAASPSPTPTVTPTMTATPSTTATPSVTITPSITPTGTPTVTPTITTTPSATSTPQPTPSVTKTPLPTPTRTPSITPSTSRRTKGSVSNFQLLNIAITAKDGRTGFVKSTQLSTGNNYFYIDPLLYNFPVDFPANTLGRNSSIYGTLVGNQRTPGVYITVTIGDFPQALGFHGSLTLYINNIQVSYQTFTQGGSSQTISFSPKTWTTSDYIKIVYDTYED